MNHRMPETARVIIHCQLCVNLLANIQCHQHNQDHLDTTIQTLEGSLAQPLVYNCT